jgi:hypothetical protein
MDRSAAPAAQAAREATAAASAAAAAAVAAAVSQPGGSGVSALLNGPSLLSGLTRAQQQQLQRLQQSQQVAAAAAAAQQQQQQQLWLQQQRMLQQQQSQSPLLGLHQPLMQPGLLGVHPAGYSSAMAAAAAAAAASADASQQQQQLHMDDKLCWVCQMQPRRVLLLPCKHLAACVQCSEALELAGSVCPVCNQGFTRRVTMHNS